jgi:Cd2+/Zn2+-exporting ATPase
MGAEAVESVAFERRYRIEGMDCGACARTVESAVAALPGAGDVHVSFGSASMTVRGVTDAEVVSTVAAAGYRAEPAGRPVQKVTAPFWRRDRRAVGTSLSVILLAVASAASLVGASRDVTEPLYLAAMVAGGWPIVRAGVFAVRRLRLDMNVLMSLAAIGAVGIGDYQEGAWVLVLFAVGTTLEGFALDRTRRSVEALLELAPQTAMMVGADGVQRLLPVSEFSVGDRFVVRPGERVGLDGVVADGSSVLDQSPITGESIPVEKHVGDEVFAGTMNGHGALVVEVSRPSDASTLARIAELVSEAQGSKAPSERFVDQFARIYTPIVLVAALVLAIVPSLISGDADTWIYRALALLIVACPCALVISIPVAVVSAIGSASRRGVLIKGGQALEDLAAVRVVAFDKTGTITRGVPTFVTAWPAGPLKLAEALSLAAALESRSQHPIAGAIVRAAHDEGLVVPEPESFIEMTGAGVQGTVRGRELWIGGPRLAAERLEELPASVASFHDRGLTALVLGEGDQPLAVLGVADQVRSESVDVVETLAREGVDRVVMLTGDAEPVARAIARQAGIREWHAGLLPEDKLTITQELQSEAGPVAMVGDGVNDAPALAAARVGVAMGATGTDAAIETADIALMNDDLPRLAEVFALAKKSRRVMRQNVSASLAVKAVFVTLAPLGFVSLWLAVAVDMGMSLLVTANALRLFERHEPATRADSPSSAELPAVATGCDSACCSASTDALEIAGAAAGAVAVACALDRGAMESRLEEWSALRGRALVSQSRDGLVVVSAWRHGDGVRDELVRLIEAERECCPFLSFEITEESPAIVLRTTFPEGMQPDLWHSIG